VRATRDGQPVALEDGALDVPAGHHKLALTPR
jgi:hypothetical protein